MSQREYEPAAAELEVLKVLWDHGANNVRGVMDLLHNQGRAVAYTTVQTMLNRLEQKGFVKSDRSGTAFVYQACITRERISRSRLQKLVDQLYDGAAGALALELLRTQRLNSQEIDQLHELIERLDQGKD